VSGDSRWTEVLHGLTAYSVGSLSSRTSPELHRLRNPVLLFARHERHARPLSHSSAGALESERLGWNPFGFKVEKNLCQLTGSQPLGLKGPAPPAAQLESWGREEEF
jgi:hypothetical protein